MTIDTNSAAFRAAHAAYQQARLGTSHKFRLAAALEAWERAQWRPIAEAKAFGHACVLVGGRHETDPEGAITFCYLDVVSPEYEPDFPPTYTHIRATPFPTPPTKGVE